MSARFRWAAAILAPITLLSISACADVGISEFETCVRAQNVASVAIGDSKALAEKTLSLAEALPADLQPAALLLAQPYDASAEDSGAVAESDRGFVPDHTQRLHALAELQAWALDTCGIYLTFGAQPNAELSADDALLEDFETVVGEDDEGTYVSIIGVHEGDVALELCGQALLQYGEEDRGIEFETHVQVLNPVGEPIAYTYEGECRETKSG